MTTPPTDEQFDKAFSASHEIKPTASSWGLFAYSDAPAPVCGSGMGTFHWFETKTRMLEFVREFMAWWHPGPSGMTPEEIADKVQAMVEAWDASNAGLEELRRGLNEFMRGLWQIEWWGQFEELVSGSGEFPARIRTDFAEDNDSDGRGTAIAGDKLDAFREYLQGYGY